MEDNCDYLFGKGKKGSMMEPYRKGTGIEKTTKLKVMPANPLLKRKNIPVNSPKFGSRTKYIKLPRFNCNSIKEEVFVLKNICNNNDIGNTGNINTNANGNSDNSYTDYNKELHIECYLSNPKMHSALVYYKNKQPSDLLNRISLDNLINLKYQNQAQAQDSQHKATKLLTLDPFYTLQDSSDPTLQFESRFDNGNLLAAYHTADSKYQLVLQKDTNSNGYHQWFFFRVSNTKKSNTVTLQIINLIRKKSKYSSSIKIWTYSSLMNKHNGIGWHHNSSYNTTYTTNGLYYYSKSTKKNYNTLSFDYTFEYDDDEVFFANCIPYTYTDLMEDLAEYQRLEESKYQFLHRKTLCKTLGGNDVDYLTINGTNSSNKDQVNAAPTDAVVLIARQHPSESPGSWVIKGAIEFLIGNSTEAQFLKKHLVFKIIPMINPDGVIEGNTRTSFAGCDLNRRWRNPSEQYHPEIFFTKEMIRKLSMERSIQCIVDFHGHMGAFNSFFYSNDEPIPMPKEESNDNEPIDLNAHCKAFPLITSLGSNTINYTQCTFRMEHYKRSTCRQSIYSDLNISTIVTLETSNFGLSIGKYANRYLDVELFKEIGRDVCMGILRQKYYSMQKMNKTPMQMPIEHETEPVQLSNEVIEKTEEIINEALRILSNKDESISVSVPVHNDNDNKDEDGSDSESEPSIDNISFEQVKKLLSIKPNNNQNYQRRRSNKKKRSRRHNKPKLTVMAYKTSSLKHKGGVLSETLNMNFNININTNGNTNTLADTMTNQPQKSLVNSNNSFKPFTHKPESRQVDNRQQQQLHHPGISSYSNLNINFNLNYNHNDNSNSNKPYHHSNKQLSMLIFNPSSVVNGNGKSNSSSHCLIKMDRSTQTEEIYFTIHWSYFIGACTILSEKKPQEPKPVTNKSINQMVGNDSLPNITSNKGVAFRKQRVFIHKDQIRQLQLLNTRTNTDQIR